MKRNFVNIAGITILFIILVIVAFVITINLFGESKGAVLRGDKSSREYQNIIEQPTFRNVTVHDPAIIFVDGTYYVFGFHLHRQKQKIS